MIQDCLKGDRETTQAAGRNLRVEKMQSIRQVQRTTQRRLYAKSPTRMPSLAPSPNCPTRSSSFPIRQRRAGGHPP
jgi:hypothetical protein